MLREGEVITAVCSYLKRHGCTIIEKRDVSERGTDIDAKERKSGTRVLIEAKGNTSSKKMTRRYGMPFNRNQVRSHVASAFLKTAQLRSSKSSSSARVGMAFPRTSNHLSFVGELSHALKVLRIEVFWVDEKTHRVIHVR